MSAAKKMKALQRSQAYVVRDELERVLPQLVVLVEAAEREWEGDFASGEVGDALDALDKALS